MKIPLYQVDAFTSKVFGGNPAAVCLLDSWLEDDLLQKIAAENNLSETAYLVKKEEYYDLRWFTPALEVDLCGHATLASAFVIFSEIDKNLQSVHFKTASGRLTVEKSDQLLFMDFPSRKPVPAVPSELLTEALGIEPQELHRSRDLLAVFNNESKIRSMTPDFEKLLRIPDCFAVIVTAPGDSVDFVSRFFAPKAGILEDPVTGSAHCTLIPYWSERLGKTKLFAHQLSKRGGEIYCEDCDDRVRIGGNAVLYLKGEIDI